MQFKHLAWVMLGFALLTFGLSSFTAPVAGYYDPIIEEVVFTVEDFDEGIGDGQAVGERGLSIAEGAVTAVYTSPIIEAPLPFNVVIPQWQADLPDGSSLHVELRTRTASGQWGSWQHIHEHGDWTLPDEDLIIGEMVTVPEADRRHTHVQYEISMSQIGEAKPTLRQFSLVFIDSTGGPTVEQMVAQQKLLDAANDARPQSGDGLPRPTVISRDVWCISDACDYTEGLEYAPATHMVVHHTVSNNGSADWAATVRAIWSFHTYSRDWGDMGYNYLIDQDGIIYEGHMNEDYASLDVAGKHAGHANLGSMGVALIGTYTEETHAIPGIAPPPAMVASLIDLLSWKADQRSIDVYDASDALPNVAHGLPHLMGHRDVYGTTECPGDQAHMLLPMLIDTVAENIGLTNPYIVIDERSDQLTLSNAVWRNGNNECGTNGHAYLTYSTQSAAESSNWGEWRPDIPEDGLYRIEVRIPYCYTGRAETAGAVYEIAHPNGTDSVLVDQNTNVGMWVSLGEYELDAGNDATIYLSDLTETDTGLGVWFDDMRLLRLDEPETPEPEEPEPPEPPEPELPEPTVVLDTPVAGAVVTETAVTFHWSFQNTEPTDALTTTLQVSTSPTMTAPIVAETWATSPISHTHTFTEDAAALYWQISTTISGTEQSIVSPIGQFGVKTAVFTTTAITLYKISPANYHLTWANGGDEADVVGYNVSYRVMFDSTISGTTTLPTPEWTPWLTSTAQTQANFTLPTPDSAYEFRIQAVDTDGNVQPKDNADISTLEAIDFPHAIMLPIVRN